MRSIHKKPLKRFLSTLLALTMVLGMVPFTALALPPEDKAGQVSGTWTNYTAEACVLKSNVQPNTTDDTQFTTVYVDIDPTFTSGTQTLKLTIGTATIDIGTVETDGSGTITTPAAGSTGTSGGVGYTITHQGTTLEVKATNVPLVGCSTSGLSPTHPTIAININAGTAAQLQVEVPRKADLTLTATPDEVTAGQDFTVTATSDIADGYVKFTYGADDQRVAVIPDENGKGIASATFTATGTAGPQDVTALQYEMTGVVNTKKIATITVNAATVYHTITFLENGPGVYQMPAAQTVKSGDKATKPAVNPGREGYTFGGWYKDADCTDDWEFTTDTVTEDTILYAKWTKNTTYSVTYSSGVLGVVTGMPDSVTGIAAGSDFVISQTIPACAGYTFVGWSTDSARTAAEFDSTSATDYNPGATITSVATNVTLYAVWQQNTVQVTYPADVTGADVSKTTNTTFTENVTEGSTQTFTVTLTEGYDPATLTVTANGVALAPVLTNVATRVYTYSFVANVDTQILVSTPSKLTYTITLPTGDHFTAKFTEPSEADDKGSYTFDYGTTTAKFSVQLKDGYTGKVYIDGAEQTAITKNGTETYTLHATDGIKHVCDIRVETTKVQTFTVTYTIDGQTYTTRTVDAGTQVNTLSNIDVPAKTGYTFGGWYSDTGLTTALANTADTEKVTADMEVYGKWVPVQGHIAYDLKDGTGSGITTQTKVYGVSLQLHATIPTRTGFTFKGWATVDGGAAVYQPGDMYSTEIGEETVTLYAVWEQLTFTVTLPSGTGYSISTSQSTIVEYDEDFTFTVKVDRDYSTAAPVVSWTKADGTGTATPLTVVGDAINNADGSKSYTYTIANFTEDRVVSVTVKENATYTVTFYTWKNDGRTTEVYQTQQVEDTYKATQPAAPVIEGYTFGGWYTVTTGTSFVLGTGSTPNSALDAAYSFDTPVKDNLNVVAKMVAIKPVVTIPDNGTGWSIAFDTTDTTGVAGTGTLRTHTHAYNADCTFKVTIADGYDASNMQVGANGVALAPIDITGNVYTYKLTGVKVNTTITVVGVVRKTVTITYNANARDDVSDMPVQQVVKYYLDGADNDTIVKQYPVRTGYEFLGWCTDSAYTGSDAVPSGETYYAKAAIEAGADSVFTKDTTLYAIWKASELTVDLTFDGDYKYDDSSTSGLKPGLDYFYEGDTIALKATLSANAQGTMTFYQMAYDEYNPAPGAANAWEVIGTASINGGKVGSVTTLVAPYEQDSAGTTAEQSNYRWVYKVEFEPTGDEGYVACADADDIRIYSKAISWNITKPNTGAWTDAENKLSIYESNGTTTVTQMEANTVYYLQIPMVVELDGGRVFNGLSKNLTVGEHYVVDWEYKDANNDWVHYTTITDSDRVKVEAQYSQYSFRAKVTPAANSIYTKAAKYDAGTVVADAYMDYLITEPTAAVVTKNTTTTLVIVNTDGKLTEAANVVINGDNTVFAAEHLAQFEGDKITLKATVKETGTNAKVTTGTVKFYRYVDGISSDELLNIQDVALDSNGVATYTVEVDDYDSTDTALTNIDQFYAVYEDLADDTTWTMSDSKAALAEIYIKSTTIKTPVIDEINDSSTVIGSTTYGADLDGLLAGVKHTFKLRTGNAAADWSVVALDGRTVDANDYTIKWYAEHIVDDNKTGDTDSGAIFVTTQNMMGDKFYVELIAQNNMDKGATSNKAIIGTKQDVNVTVTAEDKITSTPEIDVYQLNEIKLTATVAAAEGANATVKPSGTVTFYYSVDSGSTWTKVGATTDLVEKAGVMTASITTTELPVKSGDNTKQNVKISALYSGDATFNAITDQADAKITPEIVTVYSSVVYVNPDVENKAVTCSDDHASGIYISVIDGALNANETNVTLQLSDVYTLDHDDALSKLAFGTDYTVQWQKLSNAAAYTDYAASTAPWANITSKTNVTCDLVVEQGAAYRAVITVGPETDINRGSYTKVDQDIDGRQVYYSNVLVANSGNLDLTVTTNTSDTRDGFEGIVESETVTINTFASGATNTTPISELTVIVTDAGGAEVFKQVKTDVNGYTSFDWTTTAPGYYTLTVTAVPSNGYAAKTVTRTLIVRDDEYGFTVSGDNTTYNGKAQGLTVTVNNMGIENALAQKSVVVYYYSDAARTQMVEPSDAGTYYATIRLQESAYWTEKTENVTFTITKRPVSVVDLVAQAKVYDGTTDANLQEIVLKDATVNAAGVPDDNTGVLNGDSIYAIGTGKTSSAAAGTVTLTVTGATLKGDDAKNYELVGTYAGEDFVIQRNQLKGDIADATYAYTGSSITVPADDIAVIDQQGNNFTDYTVTYYYHNGDGVEKVSAMKALGMYTVVVTPRDTDNYKGGAAQKVYVAAAAVDAAPASLTSLTLDITNTVVTYTGTPVGVTVKDSQGNTVTNVTYNGSTTVPTAAGRYLVKATASTGDTAYGLYTIVKADPALSLSASDADYNSALQTGSPVLTGAPDADQVYYTWTGGTIQGVSYTAPTEVGKYVVTAHVNETANYTAHEVSATFEIKPVTLTITADSYQRHQYGEYPQMTATFSGLATGGVAPDTSLRDVQIQPEFLFSGSNDALDQVGNYTVKPVSALARNYTVEYVDGLFTVTQVDGNPELAICGMISNGNGDKTIAYYGDEIQLYAYGSQKNNVINNSSIWTWGIKSGNATITPEGLLTFGNGDQYVTVSLTRGTGTQSIYTEITIHVLKQEVKVNVPDVDKVYKADVWTYDGSMSAVNAKGEQMFAGNSKFTIGSNTRTDIGTQVVTGKVADTIVSYQSETYGGRFTVNDKDVTVKPNAQTVTYGDPLSIAEDKYTVTGEVGSAKALTGNTNVASVRELYNNLDVTNKYEILVTGTENINYNVKYVTAPTAPQVTVNDKALTVKTGVYANKIGQTSGSLNPVGEYPNDDRLAFSASDLTSFTKDTTRMYGEPNQVMGYVLETLVDGDSEADLTALLDWLVKYDFNIAGHASVTYPNPNTAIDASQYPGYTIPTANQQVVTNATMIDLVNYTESYTLGTQNIYQRPVELKCTISDANKELPKITSETALNQILIQNITAGKLGGVGGLATLLKHTIANLDLKITYQFSTDGGTTWTPAPADFTTLAGYNKVKATISVGNPDYYAAPLDVVFTVSPTRYIIEIVSFGQSSASVNLYEYNEDTGTKTLTWFPADSTLAAGSASTAMTCKIYNRVDGATKYADYAYETPVVDAKMLKGYTTGNYTISYSALVGSFRMFAIADGYIIIDNT